MKVYPMTFKQPKFFHNPPASSNSESLTYNNMNTLEANHFKRFQSTHNILQFSNSKDKNKNKRATTEPQEERIKVLQSKNVQKSMKQPEQEKKKVILEFDRTKFRRIKNKIQDRGIRRQNSKEYLLDLTANKDIHKTDNRTNEFNKLRRSKNMSHCFEPRPRTIVHRPQASTGEIPFLSFTDRPKRSVSKSQHKAESIKIQSIIKQDIFNNSKAKFPIQRKISYLKTQPEQVSNPIEAEFEQFLKNQSSLASSRKKRQTINIIPLLQFGKPSKVKHEQRNTVQTQKKEQTKKYEYSTFYDQQVNCRNNDFKAKTSRQAIKQFKEPLNSSRSIKDVPQINLFNLNNQRKNIKR